MVYMWTVRLIEPDRGHVADDHQDQEEGRAPVVHGCAPDVRRSTLNTPKEIR